MNLKFKLNIILLGVLVTVVSVIMILSTGPIKNTFIGVEDKIFDSFYSDLVDEVDDYLGSKDRIIKDWSRWDDLYYSMESYDESTDLLDVFQLQPNSFEDLGMRFIVVHDNGKVLLSKYYDENTNELMEIPKEMLNNIEDSGEFHGLFYFYGKTYAVFSSDIGNTDGSKLLDSEMIIGYEFGIDSLKKNLANDHYSLIISYDVESMYCGDKEAYRRTDDRTFLTHKIPYMNRDDICFEITLIFDNEVSGLSRSTIIFVAEVMIAMVLCIFIMLNYLISKLILFRIDVFNRVVKDITEKNDLTKRIEVTGNDEISQLKRQFNYMIEKLEKNKKILENDAMIDFCTGVYVKKYGMNLLEKYIDRAIIEMESLYGIYVDIDNLKFINDNLGHLEGDRLLNLLIGIMMDSLPERSFIIRVGGDEFFICIYNISSEKVNEYINEVNENIKGYNVKKEFPFDIGYSYGIAKYDTSFTLEEFIELADRRMYENKKSKL